MSAIDNKVDLKGRQQNLERFTSKIPQEMQRLSQWCVWRYKDQANGRRAKIPHTIDGRGGSHSDPATWHSFAEVIQAYWTETTFNGIGFYFSADDGFTGIDFDTSKVHHDNMPAHQWFREKALGVGSYTEVSPSGNGIHVIVKGRMKTRKSVVLNTVGIEIYSMQRYFTMTGMVIDERHVEIKDGQALLDEFESHFRPKPIAADVDISPTTDGDRELGLSDEEVLAIARKSYGQSFQYDSVAAPGSWSQAFMQLVGDLDKITGDPEQLLRLVLASGLITLSPISASGETRDNKCKRLFGYELKRARERFNMKYSPMAAAKFRFKLDNGEFVDAPDAADALDVWEASAVPPLDMGFLQPIVKDYVLSMSEAGGIDPAACLMSALMSISATMNHLIFMEARPDSEYIYTPSWWAVLVADSGSRKSAPIKACLKNLNELDMEEWRKVDAINKATNPPGTNPARRRHMTDTTVEKMCMVLGDQDEGISIIQDELSTWLGAIDKHGGSNKAAGYAKGIFLTAYDGQRPYRPERVTRSSPIVNNLSVGIFGSIQIRTLLDFGKLDSNGLLQRFCPVMMRGAVMSKAVASERSARLSMMNLLRQVWQYPPCTLHLADDAQHFYEEVEAKSLSLAQTGRLVSPAFGEWASKLPKRYAALCVIFHITQSAVHRLPIMRPIDAESASIAKWVLDKFIVPHAHEFYSVLGGNKERELYVAIADSILRFQISNPGQVIKTRDVTHGCRQFRNLEQRDKMQSMSYFVDSGWLVPTGGVKDNAWHVIPGLTERFKQQREQRAAWLTELRTSLHQ